MQVQKEVCGMSTVKQKRVLNRWFVVILAAILLVIVSIYKLPLYSKQQSLLKLGYSEEEVDLIIDSGISKDILNKQLHSTYLISALKSGNFNKQYLDLYASRATVNDEIISLYEQLKAAKGYSDEELLKLFTDLEVYELNPLFVFEKVDIDTYLQDCANHSENSEKAFTLTNDYLLPYENVTEISDPSSAEVFVSKKFYLGTYTPDKLVEIPTRYGVNNLQLQSVALAAFEDMCDGLAEALDGEGIYAVLAYQSYEDQQATYETYGLDADMYTIRAGYSDFQTGLMVGVVSSENASVNGLKDTASYTWLQEHAHEYGFIDRYPLNKESITGENGNGAYYRYIGVELATKIHESSLTFDEYYMKYIYNAVQE